jgi:hypothetical protein
MFDHQIVRSRDDLEKLLFDLMDDNDGQKWKNDTAFQFIQAMAASLRDAGPSVQPSWQFFADMLQSAAE